MNSVFGVSWCFLVFLLCVAARMKTYVRKCMRAFVCVCVALVHALIVFKQTHMHRTIVQVSMYIAKFTMCSIKYKCSWCIVSTVSTALIQCMHSMTPNFYRFFNITAIFFSFLLVL